MSTIVGFYYKSPIETGGTNALTGLRSGTLIEPAPWVTSHNYVLGDAVSSSGNAYICNSAHTSGATLAADSAKWDNLGACSQAPITTIGTVYTLYFRTIDSVTLDDSGSDTTANITVTPPANTQVCATYNGTFTSSALDLGVKATGANQPVYVKQTAGASTSPGGLIVGVFSTAAGSRVAQVGTVTATPGDSSVSLSWADISGETGYEVDRATNSGFTTNLVHLTTSLAANSTSYVNNSTNGNAPVNGTTYYYRVRGVSANGAGTWSSTVSAVVVTGYIKQLTFNTTSGGTNVATSQSNMPICVAVNSSSWTNATERSHFFSDSTNPAGKRVVFYDSDASTVLAYEVEYYDSSTQSAVYWVKVPQLDGNSSTDHIHVKYGVDSGSDQDNPGSVWTSYTAVYHLGDNGWGSSPEAKDSTGNGHHGTNSGTTDAAAYVRRGRTFAAANDYIAIPDSADFTYSISQSFLISAWVKVSGAGTIRTVWRHDNNSSNPRSMVALNITAANKLAGYTWDGSGTYPTGYTSITGTTTLSTATWYHVAFLRNRTDGKLYLFINGASDATGVTETATTTIDPVESNAYIGAFKGGSGGDTINSQQLNGTIDELRIYKSATAPNADRVKLEFASINTTSFIGDALISWSSEVAL